MGGKLRVGIAGYGVVGKRRRFFVDQHPGLQAVAVCDRTFKNGGQPDDDVRCHTDYRQLLEEELDILFVCLPNDLAPVVTIAGLERGLHVFCEKPAAKDLASTRTVMAMEARHPGLRLKYGFNHRYHDSVRDALRIIQSGELGAIINMRGVYGKSAIIGFESDWRTQRAIAGGGILLDQGIHMVDMMRLFAGEFTDVKSFVSNGFWHHDVEDNAYALLRTPAGVVAMLHSTATLWRHTFSLELSLERGALLLSGILSGSKSYGQEKLTVYFRGASDAGNPREQTTTYIEDNSWRAEIDEFTSAISDGTPILSGSSADALKTMELVYRIYCADEEWSRKFNISL